MIIFVSIHFHELSRNFGQSNHNVVSILTCKREDIFDSQLAQTCDTNQGEFTVISPVTYENQILLPKCIQDAAPDTI